jgi:hypothetical protein
LLHGESILVIASSNFEDIALEFIAKAVGFDLLAEALIEEDTALVIVINFETLLGALKGICDVELR